MSPILKRDISEHARQARKLASVLTGERAPSPEGSWNNEPSSSTLVSLDSPRIEPGNGSIATGRKINEILDRDRHVTDLNSSHTVPLLHGTNLRKGKWKDDIALPDTPAEHYASKMVYPPNAKETEVSTKSRMDRTEEEDSGQVLGRVESDEHQRMLQSPWSGQVERMGFLDAHDDGLNTSWKAQGGQWADLKSLLMGSTPSLLLSLVGLVFTGELLEHVARWRVFRRVDELFILVPMIGNLKGNLEMCLSARLGTSANIGELDHRMTRRALLMANMTLLCLQALLISSLAAFLSFFLGLITRHRLGDKMEPSGGFGDDAGLGVDDGEWHEGYTRPGWKQLVMVLATGMGAAGFSAFVLGNFMSALVVVSRWTGMDPDNITPPLAACLGDLMTLFILAGIGTLLVGMMDTPVPLLTVILMCVAVGWFARRVMQNDWIRKVAKGAWAPLIAAMLIASGAGMVLDQGVGKYRGFALLSISMGGLTGSIGAIHANRLSTSLHTKLHIRSPSQSHHPPFRTDQLSPLHNMLVLYLLAFPCQACFLLFVQWAGWIDLSLAWAGWLCFALTAGISLVLAHYLTLFFWAHDLDPDSYTLPIHSALVDFLGSMLLMLAYEICIYTGRDVVTHIVETESGAT